MPVTDGRGITITQANVSGNIVRYILTVADCKKVDEATFSIELADREMTVDSKGELTVRSR